ncbi:transposase [Streptomyces sp. MMS24-I2-30]|uniref:transposase n=1 Tax=Streptomyces sp. MMS24-I2-30 TaxID=3351564 RepID=UPI0038968EB8
MAEKRRTFHPEFREGAVRTATETGKTIAEVAEDLGNNETTLASRVPAPVGQEPPPPRSRPQDALHETRGLTL